MSTGSDAVNLSWQPKAHYKWWAQQLAKAQGDEYDDDMDVEPRQYIILRVIDTNLNTAVSAFLNCFSGSILNTELYQRALQFMRNLQDVKLNSASTNNDILMADTIEQYWQEFRALYGHLLVKPGAALELETSDENDTISAD